jgi:hypothetical protein
MREDEIADVERRIRERHQYTSERPGAAVNEAIDADTEMMLALVVEVRGLRYANTALQEVVTDLRASRAVELARSAPEEKKGKRNAKSSPVVSRSVWRCVGCNTEHPGVADADTRCHGCGESVFRLVGYDDGDAAADRLVVTAP